MKISLESGNFGWQGANDLSLYYAIASLKPHLENLENVLKRTNSFVTGGINGMESGRHRFNLEVSGWHKLEDCIL